MLDKHITDALIGEIRATARAEILPRFRNLAPGDISAKSHPGDLVTEADKRAEIRLEGAVRDILPGANFVGEESVAADPDILEYISSAGLTVVVDPVDGTWNFAHGLGVFGTMMAVLDGDRPIWGCLYDPLADDWIEASRGGGVYYCREGHAPRVLGAPRPAPVPGAMQGFLQIFQFREALRPDLELAGRELGRMMTLGCSCHEYRMMAMGHMDFSVSVGCAPWDHIAGQLALSEQGGGALYLDGRPWSPFEDAPIVIGADAARRELAYEHLAQLMR